MGKGTRAVTVTKADVGVVSVGTLTGDGTPVIAASAMSAVGHARLGGPGRPQNASAKYIQDCQIAAQMACYEAGVRDPADIRAAKLKAKRIAEEQLQLAVEKMHQEAAAQVEKDARAAADAKAAAAAEPKE